MRQGPRGSRALEKLWILTAQLTNVFKLILLFFLLWMRMERLAKSGCQTLPIYCYLALKGMDYRQWITLALDFSCWKLLTIKGSGIVSAKIAWARILTFCKESVVYRPKTAQHSSDAWTTFMHLLTFRTYKWNHIYIYNVYTLHKIETFSSAY